MNKIVRESFFLYTFLVCIFSLPIVFTVSTNAQVDINSRTSPSDENYYQISDTEVVIINTQEPDEEVQVSDSIEGEVAGSNEIGFIDDAQELILTSSSLPAFVRAPIEAVGLPTASSVAVAVPLLLSLLTLFPILLSPQLFLLLLSTIFGTRKQVIGIVYDAKTKKPLPLTLIKLMAPDSNAILDQKMTDMGGRYGFVLSEGQYRLEVENGNYKTFTKTFAIRQNESLFAEDIQLDKKKSGSFWISVKGVFISIRTLVFQYSIWFSLAGLAFALIGFYIRRSFLDLFLLVLYGFIIFTYAIVKAKTRRNWGIVKHSTSGLKLSGIVIRLFDGKGTLADTQITDSRGRFGFIVDPGTYYLFVESQAFDFPSVKQTDLRRKADNSNLLEIIVSKDGIIKRDILLDPKISTNASQSFSQNIQAPAINMTNPNLLTNNPFS